MPSPTLPPSSARVRQLLRTAPLSTHAGSVWNDMRAAGKRAGRGDVLAYEVSQSELAQSEEVAVRGTW